MKEKASRDTQLNELTLYFFFFEKKFFFVYDKNCLSKLCLLLHIFYDNCLRLKPVCYLKIRTVYLLIKDVLFMKIK